MYYALLHGWYSPQGCTDRRLRSPNTGIREAPSPHDHRDTDNTCGAIHVQCMMGHQRVLVSIALASAANVYVLSVCHHAVREREQWITHQSVAK